MFFVGQRIKFKIGSLRQHVIFILHYCYRAIGCRKFDVCSAFCGLRPCSRVVDS